MLLIAIVGQHSTVSDPENKQQAQENHFLCGLNMAASGAAGSPSRLVQYVVVRSDLVHKLSWPLGAVITQACHAATAAIHLHYSDPDTQRYLSELDSMHKAPDDAALSALSENLTQAGVSHKLWIEQPENIPTCLALKPYPKETVQPLLRKFKLFK
ncbi:hypothetical protein INR49_018941 [Caranx melampygus]|nr:hypothetical protein INR49_018941 [Caranx melampygus]